MNRIEHHYRFPRRAYARTVSARQCGYDRRLRLIVVFMLAGMIIALWMSYLWKLDGSVLLRHPTSVETIDTLHKRSRIANTNFIDRWDASAGNLEAFSMMQGAERAPEDCQPMFGRVVKVASISSRCGDASTRLAANE